MAYAVRRLCSDFMDMLRRLISCRIIIIIIIKREKQTWAGLMLSDGGSELLAGDEAPFLMDDDLSEAMVDRDDDDEDDGGSSAAPHDRRRSVWPFWRAAGGGTSATLGPSTVGELAMAVSSSSAPLSTSSQPSNSLVGAVDGVWWPAARGGVWPVVVAAAVERSVPTESKSWSRLFN